MENRTNSNTGFMALLQGIVIGGILGVLFAPKKGEETRKEIKQRIDQAAGDLNSKGMELKENVEQAKDNIVENIEKTTNNIMDRAEDIRNEVNDKVDAKKNEVKKKIDEVEKESNNK